MKTKYVVIDHEGQVSLNAKSKDIDPESFSTFREAETRAKQLAAYEPGETIDVYELTGEVCVPVGKVESFRKHPLEHYK